MLDCLAKTRAYEPKKEKHAIAGQECPFSAKVKTKDSNFVRVKKEKESYLLVAEGSDVVGGGHHIASEGSAYPGA